MWYLLWIFVMCLVHMQFKYCATFLVISLKVIETSLIVMAIQIYFNGDIWEQVENIQTVYKGYFQEL